jgi:transcriptional regulator with XRE-family HTH domain
MLRNTDFSSASSAAVVRELCRRLDEIRLSKNVRQETLAEQAGISRSTLTRLADGQNVSLDSFVRVALALGLADHLAACLPVPGVRPVELVDRGGQSRRRASGKRKDEQTSEPWQWGDEDAGE